MISLPELLSRWQRLAHRVRYLRVKTSIQLKGTYWWHFSGAAAYVELTSFPAYSRAKPGLGEHRNRSKFQTVLSPPPPNPETDFARKTSGRSAPALGASFSDIDGVATAGETPVTVEHYLGLTP
jgi:hypothetical protein